MEDKEFNSQPIREQIKTTRDAFERSDLWVITRRLKRPEGERYSLDTEGYVEALPSFEGKTFVEHIRAIIEEKGKATYLDIGSGAGLAALDLREIFSPEELEIVVLGHKEATEKRVSDCYRDTPNKPTSELFEEKDIEFIHTNFVEAHKELGSQSFDVITSCYCLDWIHYPHYQLFKKVWRRLSKDGVAFIAPFEMHAVDTEKGEVFPLFVYLRNKYGIQIEQNSHGLSFRKTDTKLPTDLEQSVLYSRKRRVKLPKK